MTADAPDRGTDGTPETRKETTILVVDDEAYARKFFRTIADDEHYGCDTVESVGACKTYLEQNRLPDLIILDIRLPDGNGLELMEWIRNRHIELPIIVITAYGSIDDAVKAMKMGTFDFFTKPFDNLRKLKISIQNALEQKRLINENRRLKSQLQSLEVFQNIIGKSRKMTTIFEMIQKAARVNSTILIEGESGTGKELVAKAIHNLSGQAAHSFIPVNCAALPENLLESVLFGYEKGAFTGASKSTPGFFEEAQNGTLFLDEIGDAPASVQVKILRAVQDNAIFRVGRTTPIPVNVRLIFATNKHLSQEVAEGRFREDLYYRINVIRISLPPLMERKEDIPLLVNHFLSKYCQEMKVEKKQFDEKAILYLLNWKWPGNVRELENFIERIVALHPREIVTSGDLANYVEEPVLISDGSFLSSTYEDARKAFEKSYFEQLILKADGNLNQVSDVSGIHLATIYRKLKSLGIKPG
ncbi:MAG: sigma-54 dependent transcriptional regulator [bacterium]